MGTQQMNFVKKEEGIWVSEITVNGVFNLHIERVSGGLLDISQCTTTTGKFQNITLPYDISAKTGDVLDLDLVGSVFPKRIRVVSHSEVLIGVVTE